MARLLRVQNYIGLGTPARALLRHLQPFQRQIRHLTQFSWQLRFFIVPLHLIIVSSDHKGNEYENRQNTRPSMQDTSNAS